MRPLLRWGLIGGLLAALALAAPMTNRAAPPPKEDPVVKKTDDHGEKKAETPNPMKPEADLGIWAVVVFLLLCTILYKVAWGPMLEGLHKREQTIKAAVEEAKRAHAETERVRADFKAQMDKAYAEIPKMMDEARRDAQNLAEEMKTKTVAEIQADRQRLRREIETARDQALQDIWNQAAQLATVVSAKVLARSLTAEDHTRLLNLALEEMKVSGTRYREEFLKN